MTKRSFSAAVALSIILICPIVGATPSEADLAISNVRVITGTGEVLSDAEVVVSRGRILSVGQRLAETTAKLQIDGRGKTLLPGLIDAHVHILLGRDVVDEKSLARLIREELPATLDGFLSHGVTTTGVSVVLPVTRHQVRHQIDYLGIGQVCEQPVRHHRSL